MSDNAPHWPDASGGPGVDFSRLDHLEGEIADVPHPEVQEGSPGGSQSGPEMAPPFDPKDAAASWAWAPAPLKEAPQQLSAPGVDPGSEQVSATIAGAAAAAAERVRNAAETVEVPADQPAGPRVSGVAGPRRPVSRRTRKARLRLSRIDPWSVMKTAFLFSIAFGIILMVVAWVLWSVIAASGLIDSVNSILTNLIGDQDGPPFDLGEWLNGSRVLGFAAVISAIDVVILTAVATLFAFLYNLAATIIGGLEVTLAED